MSTTHEIETAVKQLPKAEFRKLLDWMVELDQAEWDAQIEADSNAGKLDHLAEQALREYQAGLCRPL